MAVRIMNVRSPCNKVAAMPDDAIANAIFCYKLSYRFYLVSP